MRVAIIGTAPASVQLAPYADKAWDIWACSAGNAGALPRVTIWFELHPVHVMVQDNQPIAGQFFAYLKKGSEAGDFQVVMQELNDLVPKAIPFPRDEMLYLFGRNWFSSSVAWMMALAIARMSEQPGPHELGMWGIDMAHDSEIYSGQRAGCRRFMEIAAERGIKVTIPIESCLAAPAPLYGYAEGTPMGRRLARMIALSNGARAAVNQRAEAAAFERAYIDGALENLRYVERTFTDGFDLPLNFGADLTEKAQAYAEKLVKGGSLDGRLPPKEAPTLTADLNMQASPSDLPVKMMDASGIDSMRLGEPVAVPPGFNGGGPASKANGVAHPADGYVDR